MSSCKDRQVKRRAKIKQDNDLCQASLEKDRERKAAKRANTQMSPAQLEEQRSKERLRLKKYRERKSWRLQKPANQQPHHFVLPNQWVKH